jgi:5'-nucleotidase
LTFRPLLLCSLALLLSACTGDTAGGEVRISIVGTNDVHGELLGGDDRGGLVAISAYVEALRAARAPEDGAVLVIDAGDMWQGTLESNLLEGAPMVAAYNAIGVTAAAIGNHEFDFGPVGENSIPRIDGEDPRGALKMRIAEAEFPVLAANLVDVSTGEPVDWENVYPSVLIDVQGIKVGIVGVTSTNTLQTTMAANTVGLAVTPLVPAIVGEAGRLRAAGAALVIVSAHAGSRCEAFDDPHDLSSCAMSGEIMQVAENLPPGLVDHIMAGHVHQGIAHIVNGISVTSSYSKTRAFSRVDFALDRATGKVLTRTVFPPQPATLTVEGMYEGKALTPDPDVVAIAEMAAINAEAIKNESLGVYIDAPFELIPNVESPLSNLMTEAVLETVGGDVAIHNVFGGIRDGLPAGDLTYGSVYNMFPFDNQVEVLELSGSDLRRVIAEQARQPRRRAGFAGMQVRIDCDDEQMQVDMLLDDGRAISDSDRLLVVANDFLSLGGDGILTPIIPEDGFSPQPDRPLVREVLVEWFRTNAGTLDPAEFDTRSMPKWNVPDIMPESCRL